MAVVVQNQPRSELTRCESRSAIRFALGPVYRSVMCAPPSPLPSVRSVAISSLPPCCCLLHESVLPFRRHPQSDHEPNGERRSGGEEDAARPRVTAAHVGDGELPRVNSGGAAMKWGRTDRPADQPQDGPVRDAARPGSYVGNVLGSCVRGKRPASLQWQTGAW